MGAVRGREWGRLGGGEGRAAWGGRSGDLERAGCWEGSGVVERVGEGTGYRYRRGAGTTRSRLRHVLVVLLQVALRIQIRCHSRRSSSLCNHPARHKIATSSYTGGHQNSAARVRPPSLFIPGIPGVIDFYTTPSMIWIRQAHLPSSHSPMSATPHPWPQNILFQASILRNLA
jgi:hypothetical protein